MSLSGAHAGAARLRSVLEHDQRAQSLYQTPGDRIGQARALNNVTYLDALGHRFLTVGHNHTLRSTDPPETTPVEGWLRAEIHYDHDGAGVLSTDRYDATVVRMRFVIRNQDGQGRHP